MSNKLRDFLNSRNFRKFLFVGDMYVAISLIAVLPPTGVYTILGWWSILPIILGINSLYNAQKYYSEKYTL